MKTLFTFLALPLAMLATSVDLSADVLILKNGNKFEGKILEETPEQVAIEMTYGTMTFQRDQIKEVKKDPGYKVPEPPEKPKSVQSAKPDAPAPRAPEKPKMGPVVPQEPKAPPIATETDLRSIPQSPFVTLDAAGQPVDEVLQEISRQANRELIWGGAEKKNVSASLHNAFYWEAVMAVCRQGGWGFKVLAQPGNPVRIGDTDSPPVRSYDVQGPFVLACLGLVEEEVTDLSVEPRTSKRITGLRVDLKIDPEVLASMDLLNPDFLFTLQGGRRVTVKGEGEWSDGAGGRGWRLGLDQRFTGETADMAALIPVRVPLAAKEARLPWRSGAADKVGDLNLALREIKKEEHGSFLVPFKLFYDESVAKRVELPIEYFINPRKVTAIGKDATRVIGGASLMAGGDPWHGWEYVAQFRPPDGFTPAAFEINWTTGLHPKTLSFTLKGIPLTEVVKR